VRFEPGAVVDDASEGRGGGGVGGLEEAVGWGEDLGVPVVGG
jgi:hypothetical protein